jgi:hypothetical protein
MPTPRRTSLLIVSSIAAVALGLAGMAGCSKDDAPGGGPTGTTPPLTKDVLVSRANEICAAADKQITEIADTAPINNNSGQQTQDELRQVVAKITPIAQNAINQLKSLTPPAGDAAMVSAGIGRMQASLDAANANPSNQLNPIGMPDESLYNYGLRSCFTKP